MRYDAESGKIKIDFKEFVAIARRDISQTLPYDEDEPFTEEMSRRWMRALGGDLSPSRLYYGFSARGHDFELTAHVESLAEGEILLAREITSSPARPKKAEAAQIRGEGFVSAYMLAALGSLDAVTVRLLYFNPQSGEHAEHTETVKVGRLKSFFEKCLTAVSIFAAPEVERVTKRLPSMRGLRFPYPNIREGQREFIKTAYRTLSRGGVLYASAPTGTGKTVSALYPALRALGDGRFEKVFYFTPKTTTAEAARDCLLLLSERGAKLRAIILSAKERCCISGHLCRESKRLCPNSRCNRLSEAVLELYKSDIAVIAMPEVRRTAKQYGVCPYELSLAYSELCDAVICDFNYLFDPSVYIRRFFERGGPYAFLIDEAHNLGERVREAYSAEISEGELLAPSQSPVLGEFSKIKKLSLEAARAFSACLTPYIKEELRENENGQKVGAVHLSEVPFELYPLFDRLTFECEQELMLSYSAGDEEAGERTRLLRDYHYSVKKFADILAGFDSSYELFIFYEDGRIRTKLFCLDTGAIIRRRLSLGHGAVLFSATLSPLHYYRATLGGDRSDEMLEVGSPFDPSQLSVNIMDKISTRFSEREDTLAAVVRVIAATISARRGNYMIFSPSFAYSEALASAFRAKYPKLKIISQTKSMSAEEKEAFLSEFRKDDKSYLVAFCVMGGIYSEGIDLAGDSLIGAVIVGIGIPSLSYEREAIAAYYEERYEEGKQYAYIYPGMNRVFQAAGRVIRREDDRGVIVLIDDRFDDPIYKKSLPKLWEGVKFIADAKELREELSEFWRQNTE